MAWRRSLLLSFAACALGFQPAPAPVPCPRVPVTGLRQRVWAPVDVLRPAVVASAPGGGQMYALGLRSTRAGPGLRATGDGADLRADDMSRDTTELKTGVQLRTPDMDALCAWLTEEVTLWLDEDWIERDVHRLMGEAAAASVRRMVNDGQAGISNILFGVAEDLGAAKFPRLFESDVNEWDVANKVSDLLLQSMNIEVCCTTPPITGLPNYGEAAPVQALVQDSSGFQVPESSVDKYIFLQKALDGRVPTTDVNAAVLLTLREEDLKAMGVLDGASLDFFGSDLKAIQDLDDALERRLEDTNRRLSDLDPLIEALFGEEMLAVERERGDIGFLRRETCVKWLHVAGGY